MFRETIEKLAESYGFSWEISNASQGIYTFWNKETKRRYITDSFAAAVWMFIRDWYGEEIDMFEYYELLPADIQALIYDEVDGYDGCAELSRELYKLGWHMDYYLDAEPHSLRPIIH